jgi:hypothetical protein
MDFRDVEHFKKTTGYDIDGTWVPRVTSIVGIKAKPALYRFYASLNNFQEGERIKEQSATEGTLVHETVQDLVVGKNPDIDPSVKPAVDAAMRFIEENKIVIDPDFIERRVVNSEEGYAGTTDALATIEGKVGVLDIKTSQAIYRDYDLQTSAYVAALIDEVPKLSTRWILRIDQHRLCHKCGAIFRNKGGREKVRLPWDPKDRSKRARAASCDHEWSPMVGDVEMKESKDWKRDYEAFIGAKRLWEWENEHWLKEAGYL